MAEGADGQTYGLGIDTGGTCTDAAVVDLRSGQVVHKAKARTTHEDLSIGLAEAIDSVLGATPDDLELGLVGVSTTLATNSILEGKGGRVGLIGLGWTRQDGWELGATVQRFLQGGHDVRGRSVSSLDAEGVRSAGADMKGAVDSVVVSGLFSVHNPYHEVEAGRIISTEFGLPVVLGHQLTGELGIHERTTTAILNARLMPVLADFLAKVQRMIRDRGITAPVMVFKGDGTLMNMRSAMQRPVDTIMSGPAASAMGGKVLAGVSECLVVDIGGTSTDIAVLSHGRPRVNIDGAIVGKWRTRVEAVDMWTTGLGGDSEIRASRDGGLAIGPERVTPLCFAALRHPSLLSRMVALGEARFLRASGISRSFSRSERRIVDHLAEKGPLTPGELRRDLEDIVLMDSFVKDLRARGAIEGIGLTPTDILHAAGTYVAGDVEAARMGVRLFARVLGVEEDVLIDLALSEVSTRIADEVVRKLLTDQLGPLPDSPSFQGILDLVTAKRRCPSLDLKATVQLPVVGLGAPAKAFVAPLSNILGMEVIIPPDHDVGNAVGAVCGQVSEFVDVYVYPRDKGYAVFSSLHSPIPCGGEDAAVKRARELATRYALERAEGAGGRDLKVELEIEEERGVSTSALQKDELVQMRVRARAVGSAMED